VLVLHSIAYCHKIEMLVVYIMWCGNLRFNLCDVACTEHFFNFCMWHGSWERAVDIGTSYGLVSLSLASSHRQKFCLSQKPSTLVPGPTQPPVTWVSGSFSRGKVINAWSWLLTSI
jgi:hypothetical protein